MGLATHVLTLTAHSSQTEVFPYEPIRMDVTIRASAGVVGFGVPEPPNGRPFLHTWIDDGMGEHEYIDQSRLAGADLRGFALSRLARSTI